MLSTFYKAMLLGFIEFFVVITLVYLFLVRPLEKKWQRSSDIDSSEYKFDIRFTLFQLGMGGLILSPLYWIAVPYGRIGLFADFLTPLPHWVQFIIALIIWDFIYYGFHRFTHTNKYAWSIHKSHHSPKHLHVLAGFRANVLSNIVGQSISFVTLNFVGFSPEVGVIFAVFFYISNTFAHLDSSLRFGFLEKIIVSPHSHVWHHEEASNHKNLAFFFPFVDMIFGTFHLPKESPKKLGLGTDEMPFSVKHHQLVPFYDWKWLAVPQRGTKKMNTKL